jgi:hypothetical protein
MGLIRKVIGWCIMPFKEELEELKRQLDTVEWRLACLEARAAQEAFAEKSMADRFTQFVVHEGGFEDYRFPPKKEN